MVLIDIVINGNKLNNELKFCGKSISCPQILLYNLAKKLLLGLKFKIIITKFTFTITISSTDIILFNNPR